MRKLKLARFAYKYNSFYTPFYLVINTAGQYVSNILHKYFGFPCSRTNQNYKNKFKTQNGIDKNIFDGSLQSINQLIQLFWKSSDRRCVVAIDAASVNT